MTGYTVPIQKDMACANATEKISTVFAEIVAKKINGTALRSAEKFLNNMIEGKVSINNKFHTNAAMQILALLKSAENNATAKGLDTENLMVMAAAHKGPKIFRGRRKRAFGMRMKSTHVQIVLKPITEKKAEAKKEIGKVKTKNIHTKNKSATAEKTA